MIKKKMLAKLNGIIQEYEGKEPVYSFVQGECPDLEYCDDGKAVWIWTGRLHRIRCTMNQQKLSASAGALLNFGTENMS